MVAITTKGPVTATARPDTIRSMTESFSVKLAKLVLPEAGGGEVRLGSLWKESPAVVVFLRHYG